MSAQDSAVSVGLNQHKQEAKQLLAAVHSGDPSAIDRVASARPKLAGKDPFILADAQSVVAREAGFDSWRKLKDQLNSDDSPSDMLHLLNANHAEMIGQHLGRRLGSGVTGKLLSVRESTYGAYLESITPEIVLYTFDLEPFGGMATLDYSRDLTGLERRKFTPTVRRNLADLEAAWGTELRVKVRDAEYQSDTTEARIVEDDAPVSIATMEVTGAVSGRVRVCYPMSVIEPGLVPEVAKGMYARRTEEVTATRQVINVILPVGVRPVRGMSYIPEKTFKMGDHPGSPSTKNPHVKSL